ncbi:hypothetical protein [Terracidiphilus gabretensis]|uniref:hypothetical protein n=1 Tax=Terracidiphilus gabretensis TaxID=1577687 RepID=UPI0012FA2C05|nr:hypothetical protein [Terracidiphilus gabretensis]
MEKFTSIHRSMNLAQWTRRSFALAILALGIGVFFWGTAYKMSLYESSPIHNKVPVAKLLTESGKANKDQVESTAMPHRWIESTLLLDLALLTFALGLQLVCASKISESEPQWLAQFHFPPAQFLRPPPFPLHG